MTANYQKYKAALLKEQQQLIETLQTMGHLTDIVPGDWDTHVDPQSNNKELEPDALADKYEEETTKQGVLETLEERLKEVTEALERIEKGTYGVCMITGKKIEPEVLDANPAATTCLAARQITV